jgi:hypothetical protein
VKCLILHPLAFIPEPVLHEAQTLYQKLCLLRL